MSTLRSGGVLNIIGRIYYFVYRCACQYKHFKNFSNLCNHEQDFGIKAECHFFATSHGKGPYDGIGGTLKQKATMFALKHPYGPFILKAEDLYNHLKNVGGISVIYLEKGEIAAKTKKDYLKDRYKMASTVKGTRSYHSFSPCEENRKCRKYSLSEKSITVKLFQ